MAGQFMRPHDMAATGLIDSLNMQDFELDPQVVDEALGLPQKTSDPGGGDGIGTTMRPDPFQSSDGRRPVPGGQFPNNTSAQV